MSNWNPAEHAPIHVDPSANRNPVQDYLVRERDIRAQHTPIHVVPQYPATQYSVQRDAMGVHVPQPVVIPPRKINHGLHLTLSIFTLGMWVPVWLAVAIFSRKSSRVVYR